MAKMTLADTIKMFATSKCVLVYSTYQISVELTRQRTKKKEERNLKKCDVDE